MPIYRRLAVLAAAAAAALALAGPAAGSHGGLEALLADYRADGRIATCDYSKATLEAARAEVPADIVAYAPDFVDALDRAIAGRSECDPPPAPDVPAVPGTPADPGGPAVPAVPAEPKAPKRKAKGVPARCRKLAGKKRARCVKSAKARARCKKLTSKKKRAACVKKAKRQARG